jgi:hypothetical protein
MKRPRTWRRSSPCCRRPLPGAGGPFALFDEGALRSLVASAGLTQEAIEDVDVTWQFENLDLARAAMSGRDRVQAALERAIAPFRLSDGRYRLENRFRYLLATRD